MFRRRLNHLLILTLVASSAAAAPTAAATHEPVMTFVGGGFGHGIGMSQHGAYGRAEAGHTYDQILAFYYEGTTLKDVEGFSDDTTNFSTDDDVDVRVDIRKTVVISTPVEQDGAIDLFAGGVAIGSTTDPISVDWDGSTWTAISNAIDLCDGVAECAGNPLEFEMSDEERVVLENSEDGSKLGEYRSGRIILHPASISGPKGALTTLCGTVTDEEFCVIHGDLDLQTYLYGLAEIPASWPDEALKAQAVAGRSYAVSRILSRNANARWAAPFDLYGSTKDQLYKGWPKWAECAKYAWCDAVDATDDVVVDYEGTVAETFYSASNGGATAEPPDVWPGGTTRPYLRAKDDAYDSHDKNPHKIRKYTYTIAEISKWLDDYMPPRPIDQDQLKVGTVISIRIDAPPSGRVTFAEVIIEGTSKTTSVEGRVSNGEIIDGPYGIRFYKALQDGCELTPDCIPLRSTNFRVLSTTPAPTTTTTTTTPAPAAPFDDVPANKYFYEPVLWMAEHGITLGTSPTKFSPNNPVTRGQIATFLWRFAGEPTAPATNVFDDVPASEYFTKPVAWMAEHGITTGTSPTKFSPNNPVTRGQIATFLWRFAGKPEAFAPGVELPPNMRH